MKPSYSNVILNSLRPYKSIPNPTRWLQWRDQKATVGRLARFSSDGNYDAGIVLKTIMTTIYGNDFNDDNRNDNDCDGDDL